MSPDVADKFTLIIPTYNRPGDLARLLTSLARQNAAFPVLVLDSSNDENSAVNAATAEKLSLNIRLIRYDPRMPPFEKFWRGSELVETEFCSMCADDDILVTDSVGPLVGFLQDNPDYSAAHGWYFTFYDNGHIGITSTVYRGSSVGSSDPVQRLRDLFRNYEAVTYSLYRTKVMSRVLREIQPIGSMLGRELLGGALTVAAGKVARLPIFYYGRSLGPSQPYVHWHPIDFLISSPDEFFAHYVQYRKIILEYLKETGYSGHPEGETSKLLDLIHLRYLADYVKPRVVDYLVDQVMTQKPPVEIMQNLWPVLADNDAGTDSFIRRSGLLRMLRDRFAPGIRLHHLKKLMGRPGYKILKSTTVSGKAREYYLYRDFSASLRGTAHQDAQIAGIIKVLDTYE